MRGLGVALVFLLGGCAAPGVRGVPLAPGGSVADFDRDAPSPLGAETGAAAGASETIGPPQRQQSARPALFLPEASEPEKVRELQRELQVRGYYHGPLTGAIDASLVDALARYRLDNAQPIVSPPEREAAVPRARF